MAVMQAASRPAEVSDFVPSWSAPEKARSPRRTPCCDRHEPCYSHGLVICSLAEQTAPLVEREKERERGSNLRRQRLASPTAQVLVAQTNSAGSKESEWSERLTPGQSGWLGAAAVGSIPALALSLFLQRLNFLLCFHTTCGKNYNFMPLFI